MEIILSGDVKAKIKNNHVYAEGDIECKEEGDQITIGNKESDIWSRGGSIITLGNVDSIDMSGSSIVISGNSKAIIASGNAIVTSGNGQVFIGDGRKGERSTVCKVDIDLKKKIKKIRLSGASSLKVKNGENLNPNLFVSCSAACKVVLKDHVLESMDVNMSGSSSCIAENVTVDELKANISGSSKLYGLLITGNGNLNASGASKISSTCNNLKNIHEHKSGAAKITTFLVDAVEKGKEENHVNVVEKGKEVNYVDALARFVESQGWTAPFYEKLQIADDLYNTRVTIHGQEYHFRSLHPTYEEAKQCVSKAILERLQ